MDDAGGYDGSETRRAPTTKLGRRAMADFAPDELRFLGAAYETVCDAPRLRDASPMVRDLVASTILEIASTGKRDLLRIVDSAMAKLGLHTQCAA
jgi:hypothetical protein